MRIYLFIYLFYLYSEELVYFCCDAPYNIKHRTWDTMRKYVNSVPNNLLFNYNKRFAFILH